MFFLSLLHVAATIAIALVVLLIFACLLLASYKHKLASSSEISPLGKRGVVHTDIRPEGAVIVDGEMWRARLSHGATLVRGGKIKVVGVRGMLLEVEADVPD